MPQALYVSVDRLLAISRNCSEVRPQMLQMSIHIQLLYFKGEFSLRYDVITVETCSIIYASFVLICI